MIEVLKQLVDALENHSAIKHPQQIHYRDEAIQAGKQAIAELESQEPFAYVNVEMRRLEFAHNYVKWDTPTTIKLDKIPLYIHPPQRTEQEPVAHPVIAGVLFDFMGWLTSRKERIVLSSADNASPAVEAITKFAKMRNLSLNNAKVQDWHTHPPQRTWVDLTRTQMQDVYFAVLEEHRGGHQMVGQLAFGEALQAKIKERNT
jgi:hypothetical protein